MRRLRKALRFLTRVTSSGDQEMRRSVWLSSCRKRSLLHTGAVISIYDTVKTIARKWPERHDVLSVGHYRIPGVESMLFVHPHYLGRYLCASQLGRARGDPSPEDSPSLRYRAYLVLVGVPFSVWAAAPAPAFFHPVLIRSSSRREMRASSGRLKLGCKETPTHLVETEIGQSWTGLVAGCANIVVKSPSPGQSIPYRNYHTSSHRFAARCIVF